VSNRILIVHAHPEPTSFNAALTEEARVALTEAGHSVTVSDLYAQDFEPRAGRHDFTSVADPTRFHYQNEQAFAAKHGGFSAELQREQERVLNADLLILQFPLWHGGVPAIMKGWFERVFAYGVTYVDGARFDTGLFRGRRAMFSVTTGGTPERFSATGVYGEMDLVMRPVRRLLLEYAGYAVAEPFVAYGVPRISEEERKACLKAWRAHVLAVAQEPIPRITIDPLGALAKVGTSGWTRS